MGFLSSPLLLMLSLPALTLSVSCDFALSLCDWSFNSPWSMVSEVMLPCPINLLPTNLISAGGRFLSVQGHFGSAPSGDVISPLLDSAPFMRKLTYNVSKTSGAAILQVLLLDVITNEEKVIDSVRGNTLEMWRERTTVIPAIEGRKRLIFRASSVLDSSDVLALSSVSLSPNHHPSHYKLSGSKSILFSELRKREIRRSPTALSSPSCRAVDCSFRSTSCEWTYSGFHPLDGKIVSEGEGAGLISSSPALFPVHAHLQMDVFASDHSSLILSQLSGGENSLLWTHTGAPLAGWNTIRVPVRFSSLPSSLSLRSSAPLGSFVAVSNTSLVDAQGQPLSCGLNVPAIQPQHDSMVRLTAVQKVGVASGEIPTVRRGGASMDGRQMMVESDTISLAPPPPMTSHAPFSHSSQSGQAQSPIAPAFVNSKHNPSKEPLTIAPPLFNLGPAAPIFKKAPPLFEKIPRTFPRIVATTTMAPPTSSLQKLLESAIGNPAMESQLKQLAKRFGLTGLTAAEAERKIAVFKGIMRGSRQSEQPAIVPVGGQTKERDLFQAPDSAPFFASLPNINSAISSQLTRMLELPSSNGADSRPFSRQNMDLVVQNAFNAYMQKARP